jgi:hypothetical protein
MGHSNITRHFRGCRNFFDIIVPTLKILELKSDGLKRKKISLTFVSIFKVYKMSHGGGGGGGEGGQKSVTYYLNGLLGKVIWYLIMYFFRITKLCRN